MTEPLVYHVAPHNDHWIVYRETHDEPLGDFDDFDLAVDFARTESSKIGLAEVVVHRRDGSVDHVEHASEIDRT